MRNIKIVLEYDGAPFSGFQRQPGRLTVQSELEKAIGKLFGKKIKIRSASGRTDAGVHARGQVVNFVVESQIPIERIRRGLNYYLPPAISVVEAEEMPADFHARFDARSKVYEYAVWNAPWRSPLNAARAYHVREKLDLSRMRAGAKFLTGRHDFRAFCASDTKNEEGKKDRNTKRTLYRFDVEKRNRLIRITAEADGFLYHMMRNLAGILIELGRGKRSLEDLRSVLKSKDRRQGAMTAPAHGLTLVRVNY